MITRSDRRLALTWAIGIGTCLLAVIVLAVLRTPPNRAFLTGHLDHQRATVTATSRVSHNCPGGSGTSVSVTSSSPAWSGHTVTCAKAPDVGTTVDVWRINNSDFTLSNPTSTVILALLMLVVIMGSGLWGIRWVRRRV